MLTGCDRLLEVADARDRDSDGYTVSEGDCDDGNADVHPATDEQCDDIDHDCDGMARNDVLVEYHGMTSTNQTADLEWGYRGKGGLLLVLKRSYDFDDVLKTRAQYTYDEYGNPLTLRRRMKEKPPPFGPGPTPTTLMATNLLRPDTDGDGVTDHATSYVYDDRGLLVSHYLDQDPVRHTIRLALTPTTLRTV